MRKKKVEKEKKWIDILCLNRQYSGMMLELISFPRVTLSATRLGRLECVAKSNHPWKVIGT